VSKPARVSVDERKWRAEEDLRALRRLAEIKADRARMVEVKRLIEKEKKALSAASKSTSSSRASKGRKK
jgi:hypothetical protein